MSEIKLKPCPFCGSKAELLIVPGKMTKWEVRCMKCYANNGTFASDHDAVEAWDKRAELPPAQTTLYGYNIEHLELIARILQKEDLPPERIVEVLTDIGGIVAIAMDELEEALRKAVEP